VNRTTSDACRYREACVDWVKAKGGPAKGTVTPVESPLVPAHGRSGHLLVAEPWVNLKRMVGRRP
jgi:hypothetical protein